jgi:hypothetical protein
LEIYIASVDKGFGDFEVDGGLDKSFGERGLLAKEERETAGSSLRSE